MIALLALLLVACPQHRDRAQVHAFMRLHHCPGGPDAGSHTRCRGYVVDHICPLACKGKDHPSNMQYQSIAEGKAKDAWERKDCARSCPTR